MAIYANVGYHFKTPGADEANGAVIQASSLYSNQLTKRIEKGVSKWPHLENRLLDPQLYYAKVNQYNASKTCARLLSYPWYLGGPEILRDLYSDDQEVLKQQLEEQVGELWDRAIPEDPEDIDEIAQRCFDYQASLGCAAFILPTPLIHDSSDSLGLYESYLDAGLSAATNDAGDRQLPVFATIALSDYCLRHPPEENELLGTLADCVSARECDGAYLVLEQASEADDARNCSLPDPLHSLLHLSHILGREAGMRVFVNYTGNFGLACVAAGAEAWCTGWYKSLRRFRLADTPGGGMARPQYWSHGLAADIHLQEDLDKIAENPDIWPQIKDKTEASSLLNTRLDEGGKVNDVADWIYRPSNVTAAKEHYMLSAIRGSRELEVGSSSDVESHIGEWLLLASNNADKVRGLLGPLAKTRLIHVDAWLEAFNRYKGDQ